MENKEILKRMQKLIKNHKQTIKRSMYIFLMLPEEVQKEILFGHPEEVDHLLNRQES